MCGCGLSIGQKEVGEKTNEIPEIPELLELIDITECFVTIDAIGTQKDIMDKIKEKGGHFCLQLKRNQKNAFEDVELFFSDMEKNHGKEFAKMDYCMQEEKNHGRIEKREYRVFVEQEEIKRVLDIHFREDTSTANADNALANLALLRKIAFNFTKLDPAMAKKTTKKRMIDFMTDLDLFKRLVFEVIPDHAE